MSKLSFNDRLQVGKDLLKYLKSININFSEMTVNDFEKLYANSFKDHRQRTQPHDASLPAFIAVLQPLQTAWQVQVRNGFVYLRGKGFKKSSTPVRENGAGLANSKAVKSNVSSGAQNSPGSHETSQSKQKKRAKRRRAHPPTMLAVDQHLVINKQSNETGKADTGAEKLPRFIHVIGNLYQCVACGVSCTSMMETEKHVAGRRHRVAEVMDGLRNKRTELVQDKEGISITSPHDLQNGIMEISAKENEVKTFTIEIKNTNSTSSVKFIQCEMLKRIRIFQLDDKKKITEGMGRSVILNPGQSYSITVKTEARNIGSFHTPLAFHFQQQDSSGSRFHIVRYLHARCMNEFIKKMQPTNKFVRPPRKALKKPAGETVEGFKLPSPSGNHLENELNLKPYPVLDSLRHIINRGLTNTKGLNASEKIETSSLRTMLEGKFNVDIYKKRMSVLMHCEEIQMEVDIRQYDMEEAILTRCVEDRRLLVLKVPGLAENRPSVLRGDWLFVRVVGREEREYKGYVHAVRLNEVTLGFNKSLLDILTAEMRFHVRFVFSRLPTRLQHRAIELVDKDKKMYRPLLFPTEKDIGASGLLIPVESRLKFYSKIPVNPEQERAIRHIVAGTSRPAPYLVFGPPGTGKTFTIVEAMKQVLTCHPSAHILACTPSNNAADLITERLLDNKEVLGDVLRINAISRSWRTVPEKVKPVCNYDKKTDSYFYPCKSDLTQYRVIICTVITAGRLASAKFPKDHFTHVFIDEAGHAIEPESLITVTNILNVDKGQLVLAGDQKQLGPILRSPFANRYGLGMSLLERHMIQNDIYAKHADQYGNLRYNSNVLTKLVKNYRSHQAILRHPNILFYDGELQACAEPSVANEMCGWEGLPNPNFPIIFHSVFGEEMREERSPSFFNPEESYVVLQYIKDLKKLKGRFKIEDKDIGIISPYQKQVQKIQKMMSSNGWKNIRVGSVEEFQGQERKVIIVSTVRSSPEFLSLDLNFKIGFLRNPKRFNVTVTRAKALLVIIGNPNILKLDENWSSFIDYINENGGLAGSDEYEDENTVFDDILQRLSHIKLIDIDIETASHLNDKSWQKDM